MLEPEVKASVYFIPNTENKPYINHKNGIKIDNRVENLEWCDQKENVTHAIKNGLFVPPPHYKGEAHYMAKITENQVLEIREKFKTGFYTKEKLCMEYNIKKDNLRHIILRKSWKHL